MTILNSTWDESLLVSLNYDPAPSGLSEFATICWAYSPHITVAAFVFIWLALRVHRRLTATEAERMLAERLNVSPRMVRKVLAARWGISRGVARQWMATLEPAQDCAGSVPGGAGSVPGWHRKLQAIQRASGVLGVPARRADAALNDVIDRAATFTVAPAPPAELAMQLKEAPPSRHVGDLIDALQAAGYVGDVPGDTIHAIYQTVWQQQRLVPLTQQQVKLALGQHGLKKIRKRVDGGNPVAHYRIPERGAMAAVVPLRRRTQA